MKSKLILDLGYNFFAISTDYRKGQLNEILFLVYRGFSYSDVIGMPIYIRRYLIQHIQEIESKNK